MHYTFITIPHRNNRNHTPSTFQSASSYHRARQKPQRQSHIAYQCCLGVPTYQMTSTRTPFSCKIGLLQHGRKTDITTEAAKTITAPPYITLPTPRPHGTHNSLQHPKTSSTTGKKPTKRNRLHNNTFRSSSQNRRYHGGTSIDSNAPHEQST